MRQRTVLASAELSEAGYQLVEEVAWPAEVAQQTEASEPECQPPRLLEASNLLGPVPSQWPGSCPLAKRPERQGREHSSPGQL
mmetsp:Transcript_72455/g.157306  ORF Transcript_72455/g.157306 Transcript_72455/m.157306 type:complete len:83 (-) Transcript_72455:37-285(-)